MYQQSYEEYIRSILGYPASMPNTNATMGCQDSDGSCGMVNVYGSNYLPNYSNQYRRNVELETCYPEIYKVVYPMVKKACEQNTQPICQELVENMTDEVYMAIEGRQELEININLQNEVTAVQNCDRNQGSSTKSETKVTEKVSSRKAEEIDKQTKAENRESRQFNRGLRDLIKILILRELLGRPGGNRPPQPPPPRPPFPGPGRPPFPGGPGGPGGGPGPVRPPFRPRIYDDSFYEDNLNDLFEF